MNISTTCPWHGEGCIGVEMDLSVAGRFPDPTKTYSYHCGALTHLVPPGGGRAYFESDFERLPAGVPKGHALVHHSDLREWEVILRTNGFPHAASQVRFYLPKPPPTLEEEIRQSADDCEMIDVRRVLDILRERGVKLDNPTSPPIRYSNPLCDPL